MNKSPKNQRGIKISMDPRQLIVSVAMLLTLFVLPIALYEHIKFSDEKAGRNINPYSISAISERQQVAGLATSRTNSPSLNNSVNTVHIPFFGTDLYFPGNDNTSQTLIIIGAATVATCIFFIMYLLLTRYEKNNI